MSYQRIHESWKRYLNEAEVRRGARGGAQFDDTGMQTREQIPWCARVAAALDKLLRRFYVDSEGGATVTTRLLVKHLTNTPEYKPKGKPGQESIEDVVEAYLLRDQNVCVSGDSWGHRPGEGDSPYEITQISSLDDEQKQKAAANFKSLGGRSRDFLGAYVVTIKPGH